MSDRSRHSAEANGHRVPSVAEDATLRVLVADADPLARRMIRETLVRAGIVVVAETMTGRQAFELAVLHQPEILVIDQTVLGIDGIETARRLHAADSSIAVVVVASTHDDETGLRALRAGAVGFLAKDMRIDELPRTLFGVRAGEAAISRRFAMVLIERQRAVRIDGSGLRPVRSCLSPREWEVLDLLSGDLTFDQIAEILVLSIETVRSHVKSMYRKLDVHSRSEAKREAARMRSRALSGLPSRAATAEPRRQPDPAGGSRL